MNRLDFCHNPKSFIFGPSWPAKIFFQKSGSIIILTLWVSNFMQIFFKKKIQFQDLELPTDKHKTLPLVQVSKKHENDL